MKKQIRCPSNYQSKTRKRYIAELCIVVAGQCEAVSSRVEPQLEDLSMQGDGYTSVHEGSAEGGSTHGAQHYRRSQSAGSLRRSRSARLNPKPPCGPVPRRHPS